MKTESELKKDAKHIKSVLKKHRAGRCKLEKVMKAIDERGTECIVLQHFPLEDVKILLQLAETAALTKRKYEKGDNSDRKEGFLHSPYHTIAGKFLQVDIKNLIRKSLDTIEWWIKHKYDKDAFVYDSEWLQRLDKFTKDYIEERFQHAEYKLRFMHQIRHIVLFIAKEDPFYTCILKEFILRLVEFVIKFRDLFELTESEQYSLDMWHTGTTEEINARMKALNEKKRNKK